MIKLFGFVLMKESEFILKQVESWNNGFYTAVDDENEFVETNVVSISSREFDEYLGMREQNSGNTNDNNIA